MTPRPLLTSSLAVLALALPAGCRSSEGGGDGGSACPAALRLDGVTYDGAGPLRRDPATTGETLSAVLPGCDDSGGQDEASPSEQIEVEVLRTVPPEIAVLWNGGIFVREGETLPDPTRVWFTGPTGAASR